LDNDDIKLWKDLLKGVKKLDINLADKEPKKKDVVVKDKQAHTFPKFSMTDKYLALADNSDIDKVTRKKMDIGDIPIDAELDLHGFTTEIAHKALIEFINSNFIKQKRMLLVVTGKGVKSPNKISILKNELPKWLNGDEVRQVILRYSYASKKHGGDGAFYVLLRRARV